jgi:hypothetical protein
MRLFITIGRKHGDEAFSVISGPDVSADEQKIGFKDLVVGEHDYAELQLWNSSGGVVKRKKFAEPEALDKKTIQNLRALAQTESINLKGAKDKTSMISAIERGRVVNAAKTDSAKLGELTNAELEEMGQAESVDLTGKSTKDELVKAITDHRKQPSKDEGEFSEEKQ